MSKKPETPFVIRHAEAENKIFNAVNESAKNIPFCSVEQILTNILHQVRELANKERKNAAALYNEQLKAYENETDAEGE